MATNVQKAQKLSELAEVIAKNRPSEKQIREACRSIARQFGVRVKDVRGLVDAAVALYNGRIQ